MTVAVTAQLADLVTYVVAITRYPDGEAGLARFLVPSGAVLFKAGGVVAVTGILWLLRRHPAWHLRGATIIAAFGIVGAATNLWNGILR